MTPSSRHFGYWGITLLFTFTTCWNSVKGYLTKKSKRTYRANSTTRQAYTMATKEVNETDEEILITINDDEQLDKEEVVALLNDFSYYFTYFIEENFRFFVRVLNEQTVPENPNSKAVIVVATATRLIPWVGNATSAGLKKAEIYLLKKADKKNAQTVAHLVYYFNKNKGEIRTILIATAMEIFYCFEHQFLKLNCKGGRTRAMLKLAYDAAHRIFTYFLDNTEIKNISNQNLVEGIIKGDSDSLLKIFNKSKRTVKSGEDSWTTSDVYKKVGLFFEKNGTYFKKSNHETNTKKYGHRRLFSWEGDNTITQQKWFADETPSQQPSYCLKEKDLTDLSGSVEGYIASQNPEEDAQLDRERKHVEVMEALISSKREVFEKMYNIYLEIESTQEISREILTRIECHHTQLNEKLTDLQDLVKQICQEIKREVIDLKTSSQYETLPQILTEAAAAFPTLEEFGNVLNEVVVNIRDKLYQMRNRTQQHPNAIKFRETVENVQEKLSQAMDRSGIRFNDAETVEMRRREFNQLIENFLQSFKPKF